jgi:hypothetical protein
MVGCGENLSKAQPLENRENQHVWQLRPSEGGRYAQGLGRQCKIGGDSSIGEPLVAGSSWVLQLSVSEWGE